MLVKGGFVKLNQLRVVHGLSQVFYCVFREKSFCDVSLGLPKESCHKFSRSFSP